MKKFYNLSAGSLVSFLISIFYSIIFSQDCADALNDAIDGREEGIMVKNPESVYKPNTRKGESIFYSQTITIDVPQPLSNDLWIILY